MNWEDYELAQIQTGKTKDGVSLLLLFLRDVKEKLNVHQPNAHCGRCLSDYYNKLTKDKMKKNETQETNESKYRLLAKRNNIALHFGGNDFVNNDNITDEKAEILIERFRKLKGDDFKLSDLFSVFPAQTAKKETKKADAKTDTKKADAAKKADVKAPAAPAVEKSKEPAKEAAKLDDQIEKLDGELEEEDDEPLKL